MLTIDFINDIIKFSFIMLFTSYIFSRIINYKSITITKTIILSITSIAIAILYAILRIYINSIVTILIMCFLYSVILAAITKNKIDYSVTITIISLGISFTVFIISTIMSGFFIKLLISNINYNSPIILLLAVIIEISLLYYFFKIKRFKNGFSFLQDNNKKHNIGIAGILFSGATISLVGLLRNSQSYLFTTYLFTGIILIAIGIIVWVCRKITAYYKQKIKEKTIEELESEIAELKTENERILVENSNLATIIHKYNHRFSALELSVQKCTDELPFAGNSKTELGAEYSDIIAQIKTMSKEFSNEVAKKTNHKKQLALTNIFGIDNIFEYMSIEATKSNIDFNLKINGSINYMVNNVISQNKLETLIGDHIKDAIIAINSSTNVHRSIMVMLGVINDCYEFCVYDTGIEFEINTLLNLGLSPITTHSDTGGNGIGFMTTFETLKECKASLIIEENRHTKYY